MFAFQTNSVQQPAQNPRHPRHPRHLAVSGRRVVALAAAILASAAASAPAHAGVVGYGGNIFAGVETSPPGNYNLQLNHTEDNTRAHVYQEQAGIVLDRNVNYHAHLNGTYQQNSALVQNTIPGVNTTLVTSYLVHFDPTSGAFGHTASGYVDFSNPFYVITHPNNDLDAADIPFGMPGVQYGTGLSDRGFDLASNDAFWISNPSAGVWRLQFEANASTGMDELRIIEVVGSVPSAGPLTLLAAGGLIAARRRRV